MRCSKNEISKLRGGKCPFLFTFFGASLPLYHGGATHVADGARLAACDRSEARPRVRTGLIHGRERGAKDVEAVLLGAHTGERGVEGRAESAER